MHWLSGPLKELNTKQVFHIAGLHRTRKNTVSLSHWNTTLTYFMIWYLPLEFYPQCRPVLPIDILALQGSLGEHPMALSSLPPFLAPYSIELAKCLSRGESFLSRRKHKEATTDFRRCERIQDHTKNLRIAVPFISLVICSLLSAFLFSFSPLSQEMWEVV